MEMFTKSSSESHDLALFQVYDDSVPSEKDVSPFSLLYNTQAKGPGFYRGLLLSGEIPFEFTKNSRAGHEIAVFIFYAVIVAKLQHVSPISPSPFTTHRRSAPANLAGALRLCAVLEY